jgi:catechol 2,3-dioxygenase-like lactoylglutathione lyase family enzyme
MARCSRPEGKKMLHLVTAGSNQIETAKAFYDALFGSVGVKRAMELKKGGAAWGFGVGEDGRYATLFVVLAPENGERATVGNGTMFGLRFATPEDVDTIHAKALELGGTSEGEPGLRQTNLPGTYIAYFRDLEGHKFSVFTNVAPELAASGKLRVVR